MSSDTLNVDDLDPGSLLALARDRASAVGLSYAGAVTPTEAHALLRAGAAHLIDVRNRYEWEFVGRFPGANLIEWKHYPSGEVNPRFIDELRARYGDDDVLLFLCRSGNRSEAAAAAAAAAGFANAFNVLEGFEGDLSDDFRRSSTSGWRFHGLPWVQG